MSTDSIHWLLHNFINTYHAGNQAQSSKGKNEQMHPTQNQGYFQGILPDRELCDPATGNYQKNSKIKNS